MTPATRLTPSTRPLLLHRTDYGVLTTEYDQ